MVHVTLSASTEPSLGASGDSAEIKQESTVMSTSLHNMGKYRTTLTDSFEALGMHSTLPHIGQQAPQIIIPPLQPPAPLLAVLTPAAALPLPLVVEDVPPPPVYYRDGLSRALWSWHNSICSSKVYIIECGVMISSTLPSFAAAGQPGFIKIAGHPAITALFASTAGQPAIPSGFTTITAFFSDYTGYLYYIIAKGGQPSPYIAAGQLNTPQAIYMLATPLAPSSPLGATSAGLSGSSARLSDSFIRLQNFLSLQGDASSLHSAESSCSAGSSSGSTA
ncbi:hypothetical protein NM688_g4417 [Phlebia brevispora]|uniref:Uncharacterized protein n=1 Tax=Phlebia brevispora TaxID=194682 RepID=A0ACC1T3K5_9APHY|nr:hypothetical protein NM688_g4417 [Phlebia brevispora]